MTFTRTLNRLFTCPHCKTHYDPAPQEFYQTEPGALLYCMKCPPEVRKPTWFPVGAAFHCTDGRRNPERCPQREPFTESCSPCPRRDG